MAARQSHPRCGQLAAGVAGVDDLAGFEEEDGRLRRGDRLMMDAAGHDVHLARAEGHVAAVHPVTTDSGSRRAERNGVVMTKLYRAIRAAHPSRTEALAAP